MQLTCTAWVESLNSRNDGRGKTYRSCEKHVSLSLLDLLSTCCHLLGVSFITSLKSNLCTTQTIQNITQNNYYFTRLKHGCTSSEYIFKWNTSVIGHRQRAVGFPQRKPLPRSSANSAVTVYMYFEDGKTFVSQFVLTKRRNLYSNKIFLGGHPRHMIHVNRRFRDWLRLLIVVTEAQKRRLIWTIRQTCQHNILLSSVIVEIWRYIICNYI
jgi:hypothetical protein